MDGTVYEFGDYVLDVGEQRLRKDGQDISLPPRVFDVLKVLVERHNQLVSYDELMQAVWHETFVEETNLRYSIHLLRKSLDSDFIETIPKRGYRFNGQVETGSRQRSASATSNVDDSEQRTEAAVPPETSLPREKYFLPLLVLLIVTLGAVIGWLFIYPRYVRNGVVNESGSGRNVSYERITTSGRAFFVGLSPDGQNAAYVVLNARNTYDIVLHNLPSKSEAVVLKDNETEPLSLNFSPDGNFLYFVVESKEKLRSILRIPIYGGKTESITTRAAHFFSVSPDGDWLAYFLNEPDKDATHLAVCRSADGGGEKIIATLSGAKLFDIWGIQPAWSSDGRKIAVVLKNRARDGSTSVNAALAEVHLSDGRVSEIRTPAWFSLGQPYWDKDGKGLSLLAMENAQARFQIWHLDYPSGDARKITNDTENYREFRPGPNSDFLIGATIARSENLYVMSLDDQSEIRQLTFDTDIKNGYHGLKWTVDGKSLIYVRSNFSAASDLWKIDIDSLEKTQLTFDSAATISAIDVTPDGQSVVFVSPKSGVGHIYQIDIDGSNLRQLTTGEGEGMVDVSPDGQWIYYVVPGDIPEALWKMPLSGNGSPTKILDGVHGPNVVSPTDPRKIVAYYFDKSEKVAKPWKFILFDDEGHGEMKTLPIYAMRRIDWKRDGSGVYFIENSESFNNVWFFSTGEFKKEQVTHFTDLKVSNLSISPDGKRIALTRGASIGNIVRISGW